MVNPHVIAYISVWESLTCDAQVRLISLTRLSSGSP
jgi:hypothetical protein